MDNNKSETKKVGIKTGIPLDDDKLEMVSGGQDASEGNTGFVECNNSPDGKHKLLIRTTSGGGLESYCEYCFKPM